MAESSHHGDGPRLDRRQPWVAALLAVAQPPLAAFYLARPYAAGALTLAFAALGWLVLVRPLSFKATLAGLLAAVALVVGTAIWGFVTAK
jgi:hypothetical protein